MRLKQLEIKGFKSFAGQTVVHFDADVIGIVGPNGSGKSNIVDAIRWVLGEQKGSELRLDKMASIIFNGTRKKKAGNLASVSLTFENDKALLPTEYQTVTITRMLYRSGDSEYRLNGVTCRLKDIKNLFLDTGIGSNSYAIIALGMVDDILADKDNSRRRMFEQAAGVSKYKDRKKETLRKLKHTEEDLDRIEDLLHEINSNLTSLEKQAKRARKYRDLKGRYRDGSLLLTGLRVAKLGEERNKLQVEVTEAEDAYRAIDTKITQLEAQLAQERAQHIDKEKLVGERQRELNALVGELRGLENERQLLQQRKTFVGRQREKLSQELSTAATQLREYVEQIETFTRQVSEATDERQQRDAARTAAEQALTDVKARHAGLKSELDGGLRQQQDDERRVFELEKRRAINGNQVENFRYQVERNQGEMDERRAERSSLESALTELEASEAELLTTVTTLEDRERQRREALEETDTNVEHLQTELSRVTRGLDARRNEYNLTKSMIDSLEGFPESIRYLSKHRGWTAEPTLLSDVLLVEPEHRAALENYLEPYLNYYVVDSIDEARAGMQLLSEQRKGRASFYLLDALTAPTPTVTTPAGTRPALEVITVDERYTDLLARLLHRVFVSDTAGLPEAAPEGVTVLSAGGGYMRRPHAVAGGSLGLFEGKKIGRKKNLEVLRAAIQEAEASVHTLETDLRTDRQRQQELRQERMDREIQTKQRELNQLQQRRASLQARVESFTTFFTSTEAKNTKLGIDTDDLLRLNEDIDRRIAELRGGVSERRDALAATDEAFRQLSDELAQASAAYHQDNITYIQQHNRVQNLERELAFRQSRQRELATSETQGRQQLKELEGEARHFDQQETELQHSLERMYVDKKAYQATLNTAEQAYFEARTTINAFEDQLRRDNRARQDAQVRVNQLRERVTEVRFKLDGVSERLRIEFNLSLQELAAQEIEEWTGTVAELELQVDRLRSRIGTYGEINPLAVDAYDEMKLRHETIAGQRDDIVDAKATLTKTIQEIEETATVQFLEAFDRVRGYFIDVFRSLFTEDDTCDLILLNPEDPLESGIEIVAKPKGKRPQTISQLSGGEKTLTATALLFALYLLKPAPFCIFDEVDAPLDDANIAKFNRIVKKFSRDSQFIIVTHNKLTMEAVDSIYGVYTTEEGGSGVLPVQFTELEGSTTFSAV